MSPEMIKDQRDECDAQGQATMTDVWRDLPVNRHFWAFYYYCKRCGDRVRIVRKGAVADLYVTRTGLS
jgi:hypothetical protein